ncbi:MAG: amidohydrolase family protein [Gemmataceae bacterium]
MSAAPLLLIENGELFDPEPRGRQSILIGGGKILHVGAFDPTVIEGQGVECDVIDAAGRIVTPGFIDPHEHLLGGSGEQGFATQSPEIRLAEIVQAGITTVVGCLGVDTTMKTMPGLLARAKALREEGITAFLYTGGYNVPPTTILNSVRDDILFIAEVIGAGEIAIADERSTDPNPQELARLVDDAHVGGMLAAKAGVTHFHVGPGKKRLALLRTIIDDFDLNPEWLYPSHIGRSEKLLDEAVALAKRGSHVDIDTVEQDLHRWLKRYLDRGGPTDRFTVSSDAAITSPTNLFNQIRDCIVEHAMPTELVLSLVTANPARVLKLASKGSLRVGGDADVLVIALDHWELVEVIAGGRRLLEDGQLKEREKFEMNSNRAFVVAGAQGPSKSASNGAPMAGTAFAASGSNDGQ